MQLTNAYGAVLVQGSLAQRPSTNNQPDDVRSHAEPFNIAPVLTFHVPDLTGGAFGNKRIGAMLMAAHQTEQVGWLFLDGLCARAVLHRNNPIYALVNCKCGSYLCDVEQCYIVDVATRGTNRLFTQRERGCNVSCELKGTCRVACQLPVTAEVI